MLRRAAVVLALCLGTALAVAQPDPGGFGAPPLPPPAEEGMRKPEVLTQRPSGFWTSTRPADGARYRWRIMAAGLTVLAITGGLLFLKLRRVSAERDRA